LCIMSTFHNLVLFMAKAMHMLPTFTSSAAYFLF
jgi:hypothetical protein